MRKMKSLVSWVNSLFNKTEDNFFDIIKTDIPGSEKSQLVQIFVNLIKK